MGNKLVFITIAAVIVVAGIFWITTFSKKSPSQSTSFTNQTANDGNKASLGTDICAEFPKEWVASVIGKNIIKTEAFHMGNTNNCQYFVDDTNAAFIKLENLTIENQKIGQKALGRSITTDPRIKMENVIAIQPDGLINVIYLVINPNLYVSIDRTSAKAYDNEGEIAFAIKVAEKIQNGLTIIDFKSTAPSQTETPKAQAPLPQETDIVRSFFNIIGEHRTADAVSMLTPTQAGNDTQKQTWAVMFNAFESVNVKNIESSMPEEWSNNKHTYKVTLDIKMKPESVSAAIPYYGYENGTNIRFITLEKIDNLWKIDGIATGP